jgi:hypothetical protein
MLPVAVRAQQVNIDFDRDADFTKYKTYAHQICHRVENPLVDKRIVKELESRIAMKGLIRAQAAADVNVTYHSSTSEEFVVDTNSWGYGFGGGWYWGHGGGYLGHGAGGPISSTTTVRKYTRGTLVVDIWDARTKQLTWRGTATDTVSENPEKNENNLKKAMDKMFRKYPPANKRIPNRVFSSVFNRGPDLCFVRPALHEDEESRSLFRWPSQPTRRPR